MGTKVRKEQEFSQVQEVVKMFFADKRVNTLLHELYQGKTPSRQELRQKLQILLMESPTVPLNRSPQEYLSLFINCLNMKATHLSCSGEMIWFFQERPRLFGRGKKRHLIYLDGGQIWTRGMAWCMFNPTKEPSLKHWLNK
jgi:hypothetical protein